MNFNKNARKWGAPNIQLKFVYSEKPTKFREISTLLLSYCSTSQT